MTVIDPIYNAGIQKALNEKAGQALTPDGQLGPKSFAAMKVFQQKSGLPQTGIYDDTTRKILDPFIKSKYLTYESIQRAAQELSVSEAHIRTVCDVEARGSGFLNDGRVLILFERHKMLESLRKRKSADEVSKLMLARPDLVNVAPGGYVGNAGEYPRFEAAWTIDPYSAVYATSFGLFQIMGFNFADAGFHSIDDFYNTMKMSETEQLMAFVNFNRNYRGGILAQALRSSNWTTYAYNYNGSAYKVNNYDVKLKNSFDKFQKNIFAA